MSDRLNLLYAVYWGATEALGQSLVLPVVEGLARSLNVTLMSFDKPMDLADGERLASVRARLDAAGVRWSEQRYTKRPPVLSSFFDVACGLRAAGRAHRRNRFDVVLGRTFVGGLIGSAFARRTGIPFIYHTEGCWVDEQVDVGAWRPGSLPHRIGHLLDRRMLGAAAGVVVLSDRGAARLRRLHPAVATRPMVVAPSASGIVERSSAERLRSARDPGDGLRLVYIGSVAGKYLLGPLLDFVVAARRALPRTRINVLAHRDRDLVRRAVAERGLETAVDLGHCPLDEVPEHLLRADAGLFFMAPGRSEECVSPTKVGEYLAHGLPVVCTRASGDAAALVERHGIGVVLDELTPEAYQSALARLLVLIRDPDLPGRAQQVARVHYSLQAGVERQLDLIMAASERHRAS